MGRKITIEMVGIFYSKIKTVNKFIEKIVRKRLLECRCDFTTEYYLSEKATRGSREYMKRAIVNNLTHKLVTNYSKNFIHEPNFVALQLCAMLPETFEEDLKEAYMEGKRSMFQDFATFRESEKETK